MNEWTTRFSVQKASGLTVKEWCDQNNLSIHTYNYWKHALKEELPSQVLPDIVPIVIPESSASPAPIVFNDSALTNCAIRSTAKLTCNNISIEFDSLAAIIERKYKAKLFVPNTLFLFCGRSASKIKGLLWEGDGFLLLYKRVESGHFSWPFFLIYFLCKTENFILCFSHLLLSAMHSFRRLPYCFSTVSEALHGIFLFVFLTDLSFLYATCTVSYL